VAEEVLSGRTNKGFRQERCSVPSQYVGATFLDVKNEGTTAVKVHTTVIVKKPPLTECHDLRSQMQEQLEALHHQNQ